MWHTGGQNQRVRALHRVTPWCQPWGFMEPATHQQEGSRGGGGPQESPRAACRRTVQSKQPE